LQDQLFSSVLSIIQLRKDEGYATFVFVVGMRSGGLTDGYVFNDYFSVIIADQETVFSGRQADQFEFAHAVGPCFGRGFAALYLD
jgi:hypothetical protein